MLIFRMLAIVVLAAVAGLLNAARAKMPLVPDYNRIRAVEKIARDGSRIATPEDTSLPNNSDTSPDTPENAETNGMTEDAQNAEDDEESENPVDRAAVEQLKAHYEAGGLVVDARPAAEFEKGHLDAPMVINVPSDDYQNHLDFLYNFQASPIVLYCTSKKCDMAEDLKYSLEQLGFMDLHVFKPGWEDGILKFKLPTATGPSRLRE
ncbi:MAG: rhodanese-like domain-containing protein [Phycisphaerae bacterium]